MGRILLILRLCCCVLGVAALLRGPGAQGQDEPRAKERLEFMKAEVGSLELEPSELRPKAAFTFASEPLLPQFRLPRSSLKNTR